MLFINSRYVWQIFIKIHYSLSWQIELINHIKYSSNAIYYLMLSFVTLYKQTSYLKVWQNISKQERSRHGPEDDELHGDTGKAHFEICAKI